MSFYRILSIAMKYKVTIDEYIDIFYIKGYTTQNITEVIIVNSTQTTKDKIIYNARLRN